MCYFGVGVHLLALSCFYTIFPLKAKNFDSLSIITVYSWNLLVLNYCLYWNNVTLSYSYNVMILYTMYWTLDVLIIFLCSPEVQYTSNRLKLSQIPHSPDSNRWLNNFNASSSSSSFREKSSKFLSNTLRKNISTL